MTDERLDIGDRDRVDTGEGLVEQHEGGIGGQGAGNFQPSALAAGERDGRSLAKMRDREFFEQAAQLDILPAAIRLVQFEHGADVLLHRQAAKDRCLLREIADAEPGAAIHRHRRHVVAVDLDRTLIDGTRPVIM